MDILVEEVKNYDLSHDELKQIEKNFVLHSWSVQNKYNSPVVVGGKGSSFFDMDGNSYLDFSSQAMCNSLGHQHPRVVKAIQEQAEKLCFVQGTWATIPRALLAKKLAEVTPKNIVKAFFTNAGAEANENAIKIARMFTGKQKIITRYRSYHGASAGAMSLTGDPRRWPVEPGIPGVVRAMDCYCYRCPFNLKYPSCDFQCANHIDEIIQLEGAEYTAAVLVEPVVGSNGILVPPDGYMQRLRQICTKNKVLLIFDEVMTGFGRTGKWFAAEHWNIEPDIITCAKGISAATIPLGAVLISKEISDYLDDKTLFAGLTYLGHPLACAAGLATLETYEEEGLIERSALLGNHLMTRLNQLKEKHECIGEVRGLGLFAAIELVKNRKTKEPMGPFNGSSPVIGEIVREALQRGVSFSARWNFFIIAPPLIISQEELDMGIDLLDELLIKADKAVE